MIDLTPSAQIRLDEYLNDLRRELSGSSSVDVAEVERDIRDHIEAELAGRTAPVEFDVLDEVLQSLGTPAQWLPQTESAWYLRSPTMWPALFKRGILRFGRRCAGGPESYRLAYLSLFVLSLGWYLMPSGRLDEVVFRPIVATFVSFTLSRAALALFGADRLSMGQKWLLYPGLLAVYVPVAALLFLLPTLILFMTAVKNQDAFERAHPRLEFLDGRMEQWDRKIAGETERLNRAQFGKSTLETSPTVDAIKANLVELHSQREAVVKELQNTPRYAELWGVSLSPIKVTYGLIAVAGASWFVIGVLWTLLPIVARNVFAPFVGSSRRTGFAMAIIGLIMSFGGVLFFL